MRSSAGTFRALVAVFATGTVALAGAVGASASSPSLSVGPPVPFSVGDVFAGIGNGRWNHFSPTGTLLATLDDGRIGSVGGFTPASATAGMCFDAAGDMYGVNFGANSMSKFSKDGTLLAASVGTFNAQPESCLIAGGDTIFTSEVIGTGDILKLDLAGTELARYDVRRSDWIDLAADHCTMLYSDEGPAIHRFDVCTNAPLADFTGGGGEFYALRIMPDGTVLAASSTSVKHFDSSGAQIASYTAAGESRLFALNVDPDGAHFWTGGLSGQKIYKFAITPAGPPLLSFDPQVAAGGGTGMAGLAVFGERTASQPSPSPSPASSSTPPAAASPTPTATAGTPASQSGTPWWLLPLAVLILAIVVGLFLVAMRRRRRSSKD